MYSGTQTKDLQKLTKKLMDESSKHPIAPAEIEDLRKVLRFHEYRYYVMDDPLLADYEYDQLFKALEKIEKENPSLTTGFTYAAGSKRTHQRFSNGTTPGPDAFTGKFL